MLSLIGQAILVLRKAGEATLAAQPFSFALSVICTVLTQCACRLSPSGGSR